MISRRIRESSIVFMAISVPQNKKGGTWTALLKSLSRKKRRSACSLQIARGHFAVFRVGLQFVGQFLTFGQGAHTCTFNSGNVNEHICSTFIRDDEAKAFIVVEPFHGTSSHIHFLM